MKIDAEAYLRGIQYTDWVKADSQFDYDSYAECYANRTGWDNLPAFTMTLSARWASALEDSSELYIQSNSDSYWEWVLDGNDSERCDGNELIGMGFYGNKFLVFVYRLYITGRDWDSYEETYGARKTQYGARVEMLKYPITKTKKDLTNFVKPYGKWLGGWERWENPQEQDIKKIRFDDYLVPSAMDWNYEVETTLKQLKDSVVKSICRMMYQQHDDYRWNAYMLQPHLFPLSYGFVNFKGLKK